MAQPSVQGRFLWQAHLAEDGAAVIPFYARVLGWKTQPWAADPKITIFAAASGPVAGMSPMTDERRAQGARSQWLPFIGAEDVDAMVAGAEKLGARVLAAAIDIDQVGRYAVLADPQGAAFALFKPLQSAAPKGTPQNGEMAWQELATTDFEAAFNFYRALFGWQLIHRMDMGANGFYLIFGSDGVQRGGIYKQSHPAPGPFWLTYTSVPDADKAAATAVQSGGHIVNGPMDVPGGGRIAQLRDPKGVPFAVHSMGASSTAPKPPAAAASSTPPPKASPPTLKPASTPPKPATPPPAPPPKAPAPAKPAASPTAVPAARPAPANAAVKKAVAKKAAPKKAAPKKKAAKKKAAKKAARPAARKVARKAARKSARKVAARKGARKTVAKKKARRGGKARRKK
jgi:predicted enzyme related to lactoylglutathione lyase